MAEHWNALVALPSRWARLVLVPAMILMRVGVTLCMGRSFLPFMLSYLDWVP
jgi:hypothetical protein